MISMIPWKFSERSARPIRSPVRIIRNIASIYPILNETIDRGNQ